MQLQASLSDCDGSWGAAMRAAERRRSSHEDMRPATVLTVQVLAPTSEAEEAGQVANMDASLDKQPAVQGPRPSRCALSLLHGLPSESS